MGTTKAAAHDYAHRSLFEKLGVTSEARIATVGQHDLWFVGRLSAYVTAPPSSLLRTQYDLIFVRIDTPRDLARIARAAVHIVPNGAIWIFHPKGRGAAPGDRQIRAAGLAAGLVDNKICAYSDSHTAIRFVVPRERR
jgi:hypothetical protein